MVRYAPLALWVCFAAAAGAAPARQPCSGSVTGRVVEPLTAAGPEQKPDPKTAVAGLEGAAVRLEGGRTPLAFTTHSDGRFAFRNLPGGTYRLTTYKPGYAVISGPEKPLQLSPDGCIDVTVIAQPDRRVAGHVYSADGKPASGIRITLLPAARLKLALDSDALRAYSNAEGRFEMKNVPAGEYYMGVNLDQPESPAMPYAQFFYPGTKDPQMAQVLSIAEEGTVVEADLQLPEPERQRTISGVAVWPDGRPAAGAAIYLEDARFTISLEAVLATTDQAGMFTVTCSESGEYRLHAVSACKLVPDCRSARPVEIRPWEIPGPRVVLDQPGHSALEAYKREIEALSDRAESAARAR